MALKSYFEKGKVELACDEAGRGCLAGPVYAAAVILNPRKTHSLLNDSKQLGLKKRDKLRAWIEQNAIAWAVASVSEKEIDKINILNASFLAMHRAIDQINIHFDQLLIDGNRFNPYQKIEHHCIIKGDAKYKSIAAASILAKTHRDEFMVKMAGEFPEYGWIKNKGYPTKKHREAILENGSCKYHRMSFRLLPDEAPQQ